MNGAIDVECRQTIGNSRSMTMTNAKYSIIADAQLSAPQVRGRKHIVAIKNSTLQALDFSIILGSAIKLSWRVEIF
jgi:hypothetical protein